MSLQEKLEKARNNLNESIESQEEIQVEELKDNVQYPELIEESRTQILQGTLDPDGQQDVIQLYQLVQDFEYIRETLRENQQNGRRVLRSIAQDIMESDEDFKASLIMSFQELNKAIQENIKLYISTYKTISETLKNIQDIQKQSGADVNKNLPQEGIIISTQDILAKIKGEDI